MAVGQISQLFPVSRPAVSQHLKVLKEAGLVSDHADGTRRIYRLNPTGLLEIRSYLDSMWTQAMREFQQAAERIARSESPGPGTSVEEK